MINDNNKIITDNKSISLSHKESEKKGQDLNSNNNIINNSIQNISNINENNLIINKESNKNIIDTIKINKVKTFNKERRVDKFGNRIIHGGKQRVSFIDKVSKNNFTEVINVQNFKQYNKMEDISNNKGNNCCSLI